MRLQQQFIISLGDNSYPNGGSLAAYQHNVQALYSDWLPQSAALVPRQRFWAVPGNHDWDGSWQLQPYRQFFNNPNGGFYYQMRLGAVAFFFLDSDGREAAGVGKSSRQAQWMQSALTRSDATWQVVVLHHPPYTSGARGNNAYMQWDFSAWGADLVLAGHEHVYERLNVAGLPYIVNGLGGGYFGQFAEQPLAESVVRWAGEHGALQGSIDTTGLHLAFYTVAGKLIDAFDLPCAP
jgi:tartrate-resistant acid phosphatase type 5